MAQFCGVASIRIESNSPSLEPPAQRLRQLFNAGPTTGPPFPDNTNGPPRKRQRVNEGGRWLSHDDHIDLRWENYAPLATVELRICVSPEVRVDPEPDTAVRTSRPVEILHLQTLDWDLRSNVERKASSLTIVIGPAGDGLHRLTLETEPLTPQVVSILQRIKSNQNRPSKSSEEAVVRSKCTLQRGADNVEYVLRFQLMWKIGGSHLGSKNDMLNHDGIWKECMPELVATGRWWSPQVFYDGVYVPPAAIQTPKEIQSKDIECILYPFQKRAVNWLLKREGAEFQNGKLVTKPKLEQPNGSLPPSFRRFEDENGQSLYVSAVHGTVLTDEWALLDYQPDLSGGILAEEMGLGKTVELISLISLHRRPRTSRQIHDTYTNAAVTTSGATLIVCPRNLSNQWLDELARHAPSLSVFHYEGMRRSPANKNAEEITVEYLLQFDVVLTTYNVLAREVHFADTPPDRNLRHKPKYAPRRSPLVLTSWWRVLLDEAQLVETGISAAAKVARLIPRVNAWAVTGTPVRKSAEDLFGLLIFLRYEAFCNSKIAWQRLDPESFKEIFSSIALRHSKASVRHELRLPPQKRVVITMPFSAIEEQHYLSLFQQMCEDCGFDSGGAPVSDEYDPDAPSLKEKMRIWLSRLRQTCLHPRIGSRNRRALGRGNGPLRTIAEVLEVMVDQNETALRAEERSLLLAMVVRGHITAFAKNDPLRNAKSLEVYKQAMQTANEMVDECREELKHSLAKLAANKQLLKEATDGSNPDEDESDEDGFGDKKNGRLSALRKMLRSALETQHVCTFFVASAYFNLKEMEQESSDEYRRLETLETEHYDIAKGIRKELLRSAHSKAESTMTQIAKKSTEKSWTSIENVPELEDLGGIENRKILENMDRVSERLDEMTKYITDWRKEVINRLLRPFVDDEEGDEYEDSAKAQDELFVYITALRAIVSDRYAVLTGQPNFRTDHEVKEAVRLAKDGVGHAPELLLKMLAVRDRLKPTLEDPSLRSVISQLRALATDLEWRSQSPTDRAAAELAIVERHLSEVQRVSASQSKCMGELEKELELFHSAMNQRVSFYRHLQDLSDAVAPYKEALDEELDKAAYMKIVHKESQHAAKLAQFKTKRRFLQHLREESDDQSEARVCVICTDTFEVGVLTVCGHQYCKHCIRMWYAEHRTCPVCKRRLHLTDFHNVVYKPRALEVTEENPNQPDSPSKRSDSGDDDSGGSSSSTPGAKSPASASASIYSEIGLKVMNEINSVELDGSYGTKIDTIARHILWLREHDPGSKSIIFSQYSEFLVVLADALSHFKIGSTSINKPNGIEKFRRDAAIECFLLDAKSDSSGLNLVHATHVFLCEPLINTAIELQAIARVHRIGQLRPTTVHMCLVRDTVEEAIYGISVARRLEHMGRNRGRRQTDSSAASSAPASRPMSGRGTPAPGGLQEAVLEKANSLELQEAPLAKLLSKGRGGGELVRDEDLWNCLFKKPRASGGTILRSTLPADVVGDMDRQLRATAAEGRRMAELVGTEG